jgi:choline dehydrogenase-like flavoprotein
MRSISNNYPSIYSGYLNNGPYEGINGHHLLLQLGLTVQRIVFETKKGYPHGGDYWWDGEVDPCAFKQPLKAIGLEYGNGTVNNFFVPIKNVICTLGTLGTPPLLMQSGIGPRRLLQRFGIPVLYNNKNVGRHLTTQMGTVVRWLGNSAFWGEVETGKVASNGYLPGPHDKERRKFQYFSGVVANTVPQEYTLNLYDLNPKGTGRVEITGKYDSSGAPIPIAIYPNYYGGRGGEEDKFNICWIVRRVAEAIYDADSTAVFVSPTTFPFPEDDDVLFPLITENFTLQQHFVGTCGMGNNPKVHPVDGDNKLRGTRNVYVCDASSIPLDIDKCGNVYPVQNDGNSTRGVDAFALVFAKKLKEKPCHKAKQQNPEESCESTTTK